MGLSENPVLDPFDDLEPLSDSKPRPVPHDKPDPGVNCVIAWSLVLRQYQRVTDGQTRRL